MFRTDPDEVLSKEITPKAWRQVYNTYLQMGSLGLARR
jgi:hypothetical protein